MEKMKYQKNATKSCLKSLHYDTSQFKDLLMSEVARRLGLDVRRSGRQFVTTCPFHDDHRPSLKLYDDPGRPHAHCFVCAGVNSKKYIDPIDIVMKVRNCSFPDACAWLSQEFGLKGPDNSYGAKNYTSRKSTFKSTPANTSVTEGPRIGEHTLVPLPTELVPKYHDSSSFFGAWLRHVLPEDKFNQVYEAYKLGNIQGKVIFWQIDINGCVRTGKTMAYNKVTGHRLYKPNWMHFMEPIKSDLPEGWNLQQCFFGEHLLKGKEGEKVCVVESEKTAIYMSAWYPQFIWIASGGSEHLKAERLQKLKDFEVYVVPDEDAVDQWRTDFNQAKLPNAHFCDKIKEFAGEKEDICDIALRDRMKAEKILGLK